jgi:hypothetical protein
MWANWYPVVETSFIVDMVLSLKWHPRNPHDFFIYRAIVQALPIVQAFPILFICCLSSKQTQHRCAVSSAPLWGRNCQVKINGKDNRNPRFRASFSRLQRASLRGEAGPPDSIGLPPLFHAFVLALCCDSTRMCRRCANFVLALCSGSTTSTQRTTFCDLLGVHGVCLAKTIGNYNFL